MRAMQLIRSFESTSDLFSSVEGLWAVEEGLQRIIICALEEEILRIILAVEEELQTV